MLLLDDLLVKPFVSVLDILQTVALNEMYDIAALQDAVKENELLYEVGERSREEYERRREELERELELAREIHENLQGRYEVKR